MKYSIKVKYRKNNNVEMLLTSFHPIKMELPSKFSELIAFNTRPKIEEHMLIVMDRSTHEEHLFQPLKTNKKQFEISVTFLTAYNGIFTVTNKNIKFFSINQSLKMVIYKLPYHPVLTRLKV